MTKKRAMMLGLDGADPMVIKKMIGEGKLPHFKAFLEQGAAHESLGMLGVNPTVTPPNWASMATGNWPRTHGVTDFFSHTLGDQLDMFQMNWDSRLVASEMIWEAFERGGKKSVMLNYCESWPPRVEGTKNIFIDGTSATPFQRDLVDFQKVAEFSVDEGKIRYFPHYVDITDVGDCIVYSDQLEAMATEGKKAEFEASGKATKSGATMAGFSSRPGVELIKTDYPEVTNTPPPIKFPTHVDIEIMNDAGGEAASRAASSDVIYSPVKLAENWKGEVPAGAMEGTIIMNSGLERRYVLVSASNGKDYDTVQVFGKKDMATLLGTAVNGDNPWSDFIFDKFTINEEKKTVAYRIRILDIDPKGQKAKIFIAQGLNMESEAFFYPREIIEEFWSKVGPVASMASYGRYEAQADQVTMESFAEIYEWHKRATDFLLKEKMPDWDLFYLHIHGVDSVNHWYISESIPGGHPEWERIKKDCMERIYEISDDLIGYYMQYLDDNTTLIITSDHGAIPHAPGYHNPGLGEMAAITPKVMMELGLCEVYRNEKGKLKIDWSKTVAVAQRSAHVYINLKGRDPEGIVEPEDYEKTVQDVISKLYSYRDPKTGDRIISFCLTREEMEAIGMGGPRCGDIFFQVTHNYCMEHSNCMSHVTNYDHSLLCLCMMAGGDVKKGVTLHRPVRLVDIAPTISYLCEAPMPQDVEGSIIYQAINRQY